MHVRASVVFRNFLGSAMLNSILDFFVALFITCCLCLFKHNPIVVCQKPQQQQCKFFSWKGYESLRFVPLPLPFRNPSFQVFANVTDRYPTAPYHTPFLTVINLYWSFLTVLDRSLSFLKRWGTVRNGQKRWTMGNGRERWVKVG